MAEQQQPAAPAGFKLKLKLGGGGGGGGSGSSTSTNATPATSLATATSNQDGSITQHTPVASTSSVSSLLRTDAATADAPGDTSMGDITGYSEQEGHDIYQQDGGDYTPDVAADNEGDFSVTGSKKSKPSSSKKKSATPGQQPVPLIHSASGTSTPSSSTLPPVSLEPRYDTSIGSIVIPAASTSLTPTSSTAPKRRKGPTVNPGAGRGWRKGIKGYVKPEGEDMPSSVPRAVHSPAAAGVAGLAGSASTPPPLSTEPATKRRKTNFSMAEEPLDDEFEDDNFVPTILPPGAIATSDKWQNGLPGGNEQSRQTAAMAAAVNKLYPVGPPPKTGSGFLPSLPLDKNTPRPRTWKKAKREMLGPGGVPFYLPVWIGDTESAYAEHMLDNPRPPPIDKKALAASLSIPSNPIDATGSPMPEGPYPPSEGGGTPLPDGTQAAGGPAIAAPAKRRKRAPGEPKRKPGPPKKIKVPLPPVAGTVPPSSALATATASSMVPVESYPSVLAPQTAVPLGSQLSPAAATNQTYAPAALQPIQTAAPSTVPQNSASMGHFG